jgi:hypothetical protein
LAEAEALADPEPEPETFDSAVAFAFAATSAAPVALAVAVAAAFAAASTPFASLDLAAVSAFAAASVATLELALREGGREGGKVCMVNTTVSAVKIACKEVANRKLLQSCCQIAQLGISWLSLHFVASRGAGIAGILLCQNNMFELHLSRCCSAQCWLCQQAVHSVGSANKMSVVGHKMLSCMQTTTVKNSYTTLGRYSLPTAHVALTSASDLALAAASADT